MKLTEEAKELNLFEVGMRIQQARLAKGIKSIDMAAVLEISRDSYSRIENGHIMCSLKTLYKISQYLDVPLDYLITGEKQNNGLYIICEILKNKSPLELRRAARILEAVYGEI